jgi:hypothetical protein
MSRSVVVVVAVAAALLLAACRDEGEAGRPTAPFDGASADFETIDSGAQSGIGGEEPSLFVLRTEDDWRDFWALHQSHTLPSPEAPDVDFEREMVIAAVDGGQPSGGYRLEIDTIGRADAALVVDVTRRVPGQGCVTTAALTQPYHIVRVARSDLGVEIAVTDEAYDC